MNRNLLVYDASAGSGKTFTLSDKFARYVLDEFREDANAYKHILAVTFTNKATFEMKQRIIDRLWHLSEKSESADTREKAKSILRSIVHDYTMLKICTIDSFFQKVLRAFALEMGRHGAFETTLDPSNAIDASVEAMYSRIGEDGKLMSIMKDIAVSRIENGESWNWRNDIQSMSQNVVNQEYLDLMRISGTVPGSIASAAVRFRKRADYLKTAFVEEVIRLDNSIRKAYSEAGLKDTMFKGGKTQSSLWKFLTGNLAVKNRFIDKDSKSITAPCPEIIGEWLGSNDYSEYFKKEATPKDINAVSAIMSSLAAEIKSLFQKYYSEYVTLEMVNSNIREMAILDYISKELADYLEKEQLTLLGDAPRILKSLIDGSDAPFIYEKTGAFLNHYLLDEFQDTSLGQWDNFRPLLQEGISRGKESMLVGDVKQSIYRWRGGDWNLFSRDVPSEFPNDFLKNDLKVNYRSLANIVEFNNRLFSSEPGFLVEEYRKYLEGRGCDPSLSEEITDIYRNSSQSVRRDYSEANQKGLVDVICCGKGLNTKASASFILMDMTRKIKDLTEGENPKYKLGDIAVLSTDNKGTRLAAEYLVKNGISIMSGDSLHVGSNLYVSLLVEALRKIDDPASSGFDALARISKAKVRSLPVASGDSLFETCKEIVRDVLPGISGSDVTFINAFLDIVLEYTSSYGTDISGFLKWWEDNSAECFIPEPSAEQAVRIMTMHKAKGLGFKVVFIPFPRDGILSSSGRKWFIPDTPLEGYSGPLLLEFKDSRLADSMFSSSYRKEQMERCVDNLNLAYVSFTRPKERLYVYSSSPKAGSLSKALEDFCKMNCGEGALFREEEYMADLNEITGGEISGQYTYSEFLMGYPAEESYSRLHPERRDMLYSVSQVDASPLSSLLENVPVRARLRGVYDRDENVRKGILWHQLYSMIEEIGEDGVESAVSKAVERFLQTNPRSLLEEDFGGKEGGSCKEKLVEEVCSQIARVSDYKWFEAGVTVRAEATVLIGADMWRPDRVLLPKESGNKDWAVVVDYKFGKYDKDSPQCKAYERQVANYMRLLGKMGYRQVSGYLWYPLEEDLAPISCS